MKMRSHACSKLSRDKKYSFFRTTVASSAKTITKLLSIGFLVSSATACVQTKSPSLDLSIEVKPGGRPGTYLVTGTTNLPEQSRISIAGIRSFQTNAGIQTLSGAEEANDSILARQTVEVSQGKWQATLNLWQSTSDGRYQEAWQANRARLNLPASPAAAVSFVAVFDPNNQLPLVTQQVGKQGLEANSSLLQFTEAGEQYLQSRKDVAVSWPTGKNSPSPVAHGEDSGTIRQAPNPELTKQLAAASKEPQTTLSLSSSEFLR